MSAYEVCLPIRRPWLALFFALLLIPWFQFFQVSTLMARGIFHPQSPGEFLTCLVLGVPFLFVCWGFGWTVIFYIALNLLGQETLRLESGKLRMRQSVLGLGRWQEFRFEEISDLRSGPMNLAKELQARMKGALLKEQFRTGRLFERIAAAMRFLGIWPGLMFRARGETRWFGSGLDDSQAREILARLRMHLPENAFAQTKETLTLFEDLPEDS